MAKTEPVMVRLSSSWHVKLVDGTDATALYFTFESGDGFSWGFEVVVDDTGALTSETDGDLPYIEGTIAAWKVWREFVKQADWKSYLPVKDK